MKSTLSVLLIVLSHTVHSQVCCPQPPPGFDCAQEALMRPDVTNGVPFTWYTGATDMNVWQTHVTAYIAFQHWATNGYTYEVQYKHSLSETQWLAYTRVTLTNSDWLTTMHPVYPCEQSRFFRVCYSPVPTPQALTSWQSVLLSEYECRRAQ
jgi:hypothetical protein